MTESLKPSKSFGVGLTLAVLGAIAFSGKAIIVKLAYRYGVDAVTVITANINQILTAIGKVQ